MSAPAQPALFTEIPFPRPEFFNMKETYYPSTEIYQEGIYLDIDEPDEMIPSSFFVDWVIGPILALFTPIILLAICIHFIVIKLIYGTDFKTYFAYNFVLGASMLDKKTAEKYRDELQHLTNINQELLQATFQEAAAMIEKVSAEIEEGQKLTKERIDKITLANHMQTNIKKSVTFEFEAIDIPGSNSKLDGFCVRSFEMSQKPPAEQRWIAYYPGRQSCWEYWHHSVVRLAQLTGCNVMTMNYRGVGRSGREDIDDPNSRQEFTNCAQMLSEDADALTAHLLAKGVKKDHILNYGHSLGGGAASTNRDMAICSDRSFRSISSVIENLFWVPILRHILVWIAQNTFGEINSFENVQEIQNSGHDTYICTNPRDIVIDIQNASLHSAFQDNMPEKTPPTMVFKHPQRGDSLLTRLEERVNAHTADIPDNIVHLIEPWLQKV